MTQLFTSVIVLAQIEADLCFLWWSPDVPTRMGNTGKVGKVGIIFRVIVRNVGERNAEQEGE